MPTSSDDSDASPVAGSPMSKNDEKRERYKRINAGRKDWSLNDEDESGKRYWWNKEYSISIWEQNMDMTIMTSEGVVPSRTDGTAEQLAAMLMTQPTVTDDDKIAALTDHQVWRGYISYQVNSVYKICSICKQPEQNVDMLICCYCASTVHRECCVRACQDNIAWKPSNRGFEAHLCICFDCENMTNQPSRVPAEGEHDNARRAVIRALTSASEYPKPVVRELVQIRNMCFKKYGSYGQNSSRVPPEEDEEIMKRVRRAVASYFQPGRTSAMLEKRQIPSKANGYGVVALEDIPAYTIVGVYPGYEDPLSGEQAKLGRPGPKYSLVDLNCADYYNSVFPELGDCFTPFINEPNVNEKSNTAWIQETTKPEGRLSVITVRDIKAGEELLIGYGPVYPRNYPHNYDAYAFHQEKAYEDPLDRRNDRYYNPPCFALWHWSSKEEKDANFVCYCGYDAKSETYTYWETEEEAKSKANANKAGGTNHDAS